MTRRVALAAAALALSLACAARAQSFTEPFDSGNEGGWTWGFGDTLLASGGNPGAYLRTDGLDTYAPQPRTTTASNAFTGDYRARSITGVGVDLITFRVDFSAAGRPLALMLIHDNGTPGDPLDDTAAYTFGPNVPLEGDPWAEYDFVVPSQDTTLPAGWMLLNMGDSGSPARHDWNQVVTSVSRVVFHWGDPTLFFIFQTWDLGMDNPRIVAGCSPCACDEPSSGAPAEPLRVRRAPPADLAITWSDTGAPAYELYEGTIPGAGGFTSRLLASGTAYDHQDMGQCALASPSTSFAASPGDQYYLAISRCGATTSSYGRRSDGLERPPASPSCP